MSDFRFLIRDRGANFGQSFGAVFTSEGIDRVSDQHRARVPEKFDTAALERVRELAESGDSVLVAVLSRGQGSRAAQHLDGALELVPATAMPRWPRRL